LAFVIKTFSSIPEEIHPEVALLEIFLANTFWSKATMPIRMATFPTAIPIFFGQKTFEGSFYNADFEDNMDKNSPIHLK
jgi:hypothetical protein